MLDQFNEHVQRCKLCKGFRCEYCDEGNKLKMISDVDAKACHLIWLNKKHEHYSAEYRRNLRALEIEKAAANKPNPEEFKQKVFERYQQMRKEQKYG